MHRIVHEYTTKELPDFCKWFADWIRFNGLNPVLGVTVLNEHLADLSIPAITVDQFYDSLEQTLAA